MKRAYSYREVAGQEGLPHSVQETRTSSQQFEELLQSNRGILFKIANTYGWNPEDRADLVQEMAAQLWRAWPQFDPDRVFTTWMYRIALNVAISFVRKEVQRRQRSVPLEEELHDGPAPKPIEPANQERLDRLQQFIQRQAPIDRALLLLYLEEKPQKEIAEILGITPTNVSTKINRLKQKIRTEL